MVQQLAAMHGPVYCMRTLSFLSLLPLRNALALSDDRLTTYHRQLH